MRKSLKILILLLPLLASAESLFSQKKTVVKEFTNGKPEVIIYTKVIDGEEQKVKEEAFYENGNMEYSGEYKNGTEHGTWKYFYENGKIKAEEKWNNGIENGTFKEFHPDGKLAREIVYKNGKKIKTIEK